MRKIYIKEIYYSLQGEGAQTGKSVVFCRFTGCNLWSGLERDRAQAKCKFCDTDFHGTNGIGGGIFTKPDQLAEQILTTWRAGCEDSAENMRTVVCTGGEPLLQLDLSLIAELHARNFMIAIETNGTRPAPPGIDWICVSPKGNNQLFLTNGNELKLVYPQADAPPEKFSALNFEHFFLQPLAGQQSAIHTQQAINYCKKHPRWRLSLQIHKWLQIP